MPQGDLHAPGLLRSVHQQARYGGEIQLHDRRSDGPARPHHVHNGRRHYHRPGRIQPQPSESEIAAHDQEVHAIHSSKSQHTKSPERVI